MEGGPSSHAPTGRVSLRVRLTVWVVAIFLLIQLVTGLSLWLHQRSSIRELFEERLEQRARSLAEEIVHHVPMLSEDDLSKIKRGQLGLMQFEWLDLDVVDRNGLSYVRSGESAKWPITSQALGLRAITSNITQRGTLRAEDRPPQSPGGGRWVVIALPFDLAQDLRVALIVVSSDASITRQVDLMTRTLILGGLFGLLASTASGWYVAGIAVDPIRRLSAVAGQLSPENLDRELVIESKSPEVAELTRELDAARTRIRDALAAQERFLSNISHELKTPIATLLIGAQTIDRAKLTPASREFVESTEDEMRKLGRLLESFLTLTRLRDGAGVTSLKSYRANELVMDSIADCRPLADQYAVRLEPKLAETEEAIDASLECDPDLMRTMLNNLIRNAVRFSPRNGKVTILASVDMGTFRVAVRDAGPGISSDVLARVFDRFVQAPGEVRRERGHGLGLAIAKGIAELHGGDIEARNVPGGGAEFEAQVPIRQGPAGDRRRARGSNSSPHV